MSTHESDGPRPVTTDDVRSVPGDREHQLFPPVEDLQPDELAVAAADHLADQSSAPSAKEQTSSEALRDLVNALQAEDLPTAHRWLLTRPGVLAEGLRAVRGRRSGQVRVADVAALVPELRSWIAEQLGVQLVAAAADELPPESDQAAVAHAVGADDDPDLAEGHVLPYLRSKAQRVDSGPPAGGDEAGEAHGDAEAPGYGEAAAEERAVGADDDAPDGYREDERGRRGRRRPDLRKLFRQHDAFHPCDGDPVSTSAPGSTSSHPERVADALVAVYQLGVTIPAFEAMTVLAERLADDPTGALGVRGSEDEVCELVQVVLRWQEQAYDVTELSEAMAVLGTAGDGTARHGDADFTRAFAAMVDLLVALALDRSCCDELPDWASEVVAIAAVRAHRALAAGVTLRAEFVARRWSARYETVEAVLTSDLVRCRLGVTDPADRSPASAVAALTGADVDVRAVVEETRAVRRLLELMGAAAGRKRLSSDTVREAATAAVTLRVLRGDLVWTRSQREGRRPHLLG